MATIKASLTKKVIDDFPAPEDGRSFIADTKVPGLLVQVTANGTKSFQVYRKANGKPVRVTLGRYPDMTIEQARKAGMEALSKLAGGMNPNDQKKEERVKAVTLAEAFTDYLGTRKDLKPKTLKDYERVIGTAFADWRTKPLLSITKDMVSKRHKQLGEQNGEAWANLSMRVLRALFNFAAGQYEDGQGRSLIAENPVKRLSQTRAWYRVERRQTVIKPHELQAWFSGVMALSSDTLRDYLLLMVLTGLRRNEAAKLQWADVDLTAKTLTVRDPKNRRDHTLPLSDFLFDMLTRRKAGAINEYVFPGTGAGGYIVEPRKQMARVTETSGVQFTVHDLRRTFITIAESLDIPAYALKRLLNHASGADVTAGYIVASTERLREPMQKITDYVLKSAAIKPTAEVIQLNRETA